MISMRYFRKDGRLIQSNSCSTDLRKRKSIKKLPRPIKDKNFFIISFRRKLYELFVVSQFFPRMLKRENVKRNISYTKTSCNRSIELLVEISHLG